VQATKQRGVSWVIAEQNLGWLADIGDRTYVLQGGRIAAQGGTELISSRDAVRRAFFESASSDAPLV
jgi:ABC-type branched-subunit amino acid transport system ATPase component